MPWKEFRFCMSSKRFSHTRYSKLISPERWSAWNPPEFLKRFGLSAGSCVLDVGCGPGFWTLPLADIVSPTGRVDALDVSPEMLEYLAQQSPPAQVKSVLGDGTRIPLEDNSTDFAWVAFVYHELEPPTAFLAELARVLRHGSGLAILDWRSDATGSQGPPKDHRISPETVITQLAEAGFTSPIQSWQNEDTYLIEARRGSIE